MGDLPAETLRTGEARGRSSDSPVGEARAKLEVADSEAVLRAKTDVARTNLRAKSGAAQATPQAKTQIANADLLSRSKCGGGRGSISSIVI